MKKNEESENSIEKTDFSKISSKKIRKENIPLLSPLPNTKAWDIKYANKGGLLPEYQNN